MGTITLPLVTEQYIHVNDIDMAYYKYGCGNNVWLLIHGNRDKKEYLNPIAEELIKNPDNCVYNIDLRGHGGSGKPSYYYTNKMLIDDVLKFIDQMNIDKLSIVGHSLGAMVAIMINSKRPEKVNKLVLISVSPHFKTKFRPENMRNYDTISSEEINERARDYLFSEKYPAVADFVIDHWREIPISVHKSLLGLSHPNLASYLGLIQCKTLLIFGGDDKSTPKEDRELMSKAISNSVMKVFENCSHYVYLEEPQKVQKAISDFS